MNAYERYGTGAANALIDAFVHMYMASKTPPSDRNAFDPLIDRAYKALMHAAYELKANPVVNCCNAPTVRTILSIIERD